MSDIDTLILGASGPIGKDLRLNLERKGISTIGASRNGEVRVDVTEIKAVTGFLNELRPKNVIYLATPQLADLESDPSLVDVAALAAERTAETALKCGVQKFVFTSSAAVYGTSQAEPRQERSELSGSGSYAELKIQSEDRLLRLFGEHSQALRVLRIFNVYGPGCTKSLINRLTCRDTIVLNSSKFVRDYVNVSDISESIIAARKSYSAMSVFNVGTGIGTSNSEILNYVGDWAPVSIQDAPDIESYSVADMSRTKEILQFEPKTSLTQFLKNLNPS